MLQLAINVYLTFWVPAGSGPLWTWTPESFPITIVVDGAVRHYVPHIAESVVFWNTVAECDLFSLEHTKGAVLVIYTDTDDRWLGLTQRNFLLNMAFVKVDAELEDPLRVFKHEFGHVLGLRHNDFYHSLMYPTVHEGPHAILEDEVLYVRSLCP